MLFTHNKRHHEKGAWLLGKLVFMNPRSKRIQIFECQFCDTFSVLLFGVAPKVASPAKKGRAKEWRPLTQCQCSDDRRRYDCRRRIFISGSKWAKKGSRGSGEAEGENKEGPEWGRGERGTMTSTSTTSSAAKVIDYSARKFPPLKGS